MGKNTVIFLIVLPVIMFLTVYIYFAYNPAKSLSYSEPSQDISASVTEVTLPAWESSEGVEKVTDEQGNIVIRTRQLYMLLPVKHISQNPELPTGCEITSLAMVLNYMGYDVSKIELAENYLDKLDTFDGSFYDYFIGNPAKTESWGCFAPAITNAANRYLEEHAAKVAAYNISGSSLQSIFDELSEGYPVIIWTTSRWNEETIYTQIKLNDNSVFNWPGNEHCVVLTGFNLEKKTVFVADPLSDVIECDLDKFADYYKAYYRQAVVIR